MMVNYKIIIPTFFDQIAIKKYKFKVWIGKVLKLPKIECTLLYVQDKSKLHW